ncbi:coiled-coil domain-containing protein 12 isoform X1 [Rhinopithecus roxellana]|uniref:coiled-coil domain-containing protein 12 isoform X1 n=1 Tax=Rhinopithecus roxellana TaxID=61622 RepID=UPI0012376EC7|nr:coiled-coil domain-containing protein 12 isoform X1 [Rhinopithecus roxellana]
MQDGRKGGASAGKMEATTAGVGRLEEEALRRKERLKALREKTGRKDKEDGEPKTKHLREEEEEGEKHRELRLRNYVPEDEDLKKRRVPQAKPVAVEEKVKEQLEAAKPEPVIEEVVSAWAALAYSLLLCVLFLFATCSPSAHHSFLSLLYSLPTCLFALVPLLPPSLFPISLLPEPALPLPWGGPSTLICVSSLPRTWPTSLLGSLTGTSREMWPRSWRN